MTDWFEEAWEQREECVYRDLFGESGGEIFTLTSEVFTKTFRRPQVDLRWLSHGVIVFPPNDRSPHWRYVTSGMSNAWDDDTPDADNFSGLGFEYVMTTATHELWAQRTTLNMLAYQLLLAAGAYGEPRLVNPWDRVPLNAPIDSKESVLRQVLFAEAPELGEQQLLSGRFGFLHLVGISDAERDLARGESVESLLALLRQHTGYPLTNPTRASVV